MPMALTSSDPIAFMDQVFLHMGKGGLIAVAMVDKNVVAISPVAKGICNDAVGSGIYLFSFVSHENQCRCDRLLFVFIGSLRLPNPELIGP